MCHIFSGQDPSSYAYQTRSVRLSGHSTSIRLEASFWHILEEIAAQQGVTLSRFLATLHDEVLETVEPTANFASLLRCACLTYAFEVRGRPQSEMDLRYEAHRAFGESHKIQQAGM